MQEAIEARGWCYSIECNPSDYAENTDGKYKVSLNKGEYYWEPINYSNYSPTHALSASYINTMEATQ